MLISRYLMTWGVSFLPAKAESLGDTLFLFIPTFNRKSYRRGEAWRRGWGWDLLDALQIGGRD
jgi:hypothetical protein